MGETRVDLQHLLEDLRDAYTGSLEETILTEVVANALDSGATRVRLLTDAVNATLTVIDDGRGMQRRELARYHDVAASTKRRGEGIGFAGVGIKLGLLVSREVITETRRGATHVATRWHLASRHRAPWKWTPPLGLATTRGTAVRLTLTNHLSPLLDAGYLEETLRRHFEPLLHASFRDVLRRHYPNGVRFEIDGRDVTPSSTPNGERMPIAVRIGRRRTPSVVGFIERRASVPPDREGVAISTFGKVINRGWEWLGLAPAVHGRISGLLEAPDLAACLTLSKRTISSEAARVAPRTSPIGKRCRKPWHASLASGVIGTMKRHGREWSALNVTSSGSSRISPMTSRSCERSLIAVRAARSVYPCPVAVTSAYQRPCSRRSPRVMNRPGRTPSRPWAVS